MKRNIGLHVCLEGKVVVTQKNMLSGRLKVMPCFTQTFLGFYLLICSKRSHDHLHWQTSKQTVGNFL